MWKIISSRKKNTPQAKNNFIFITGHQLSENCYQFFLHTTRVRDEFTDIIQSSKYKRRKRFIQSVLFLLFVLVSYNVTQNG